MMPVRGAKSNVSALRDALIVKGIAPIPVVLLGLLVACIAQGQSQRRDASQALPDAPSAQLYTALPLVVDETRLPSTIGRVELNAKPMHLSDAIFGPPLDATVLERIARPQKKPDSFFSKYLDAAPRQKARYQHSSSDKFMGRATDAASRIFVTRDESGKRRVNTQYFVRVLTSVAADSASRRYRARAGSAPLSDFGSTVGNDAGVNLLHEFGPGIRQKVTGHMPDFVSRIGERLIRQQSPR